MADKNGNTTANLGFEAKLWAAADALLPKPVSGEVLVGDAARFMGPAQG